MATIGLTGGAGSTGGININGTERVTIDTSGNVTLTSGGVDVANVASINGTFPGQFKNKIIGGDFTTNPWQRGTTFTGWADGAYGPDRFRWTVTGGGAAVVDCIKATDAPTAAQAGVYTQHCLHVDVTTADASITSGENYGIQHRIEGLNAASFGFGQAGTRYVTLSFWHKHTLTGVYCVAFRNSAQDRSYVAEYTQDVTDTWEKATITIPVDTTGTWLYTNGIGLLVSFALAAGATFQTTAGAWAAGNFWSTVNQVNALNSTSNNFKIALVQLESGSVASSYETRSVQQELALAQRYYYRIVPSAITDLFGYSWAGGTTTPYGVTQFPVPMRTQPSALEQSGTAAHYEVFINATATACSSVPTFNGATTEYSALVNLTVASGLTGGQAGIYRAANTSAYLGWSAEL